MAMKRANTMKQARRPIGRLQSNWSVGQTSDRDPRDTGNVGDFGIRSSQLLKNVVLAHRGMSLRTPKQHQSLHGVDNLYPVGNVTLLATEPAWDQGFIQIIKDGNGNHWCGHINNSSGIYNRPLPNASENWSIARYNDRALLSNGIDLFIARKGVIGIDVEQLSAAPNNEFTWSNPAVFSASGDYRYGTLVTYVTALTETEAAPLREDGSSVDYTTSRESRTTTQAGSGASCKLIVELAGVPTGTTHVRVYRTLELTGFATGTPGSPSIFYLAGEENLATATTTGVEWFNIADTTLRAQPITDAPFRLPLPAADAMRMTAAFTILGKDNVMYYAGAAQTQEAFGYYYPEQTIAMADNISAFEEAQGWLVIFTESTTSRLPLVRADDPDSNPYAAIGVDAPLLRDPTLCDGGVGLRYNARHSLVKLSNGYLMGAFSNGHVQKFNGATYGGSTIVEKVSDELYPIISDPTAILCAHYSSDGIYALWDVTDPDITWCCYLMDESTAWVQLELWLNESHVPKCRLFEAVGGNSLVASGEPFMAYVSRRHFRGFQFETGNFPYDLTLTSTVDFGAHYGSDLGYFARHLESAAMFRNLDANAPTFQVSLYDSQNTVVASTTKVAESSQITLNDQWQAMHYYVLRFAWTGAAIELIQLSTKLMVTDRNDATEVADAAYYGAKPWGSGIAMFGYDGIATASTGTPSAGAGVANIAASPSWANGLNAVHHTSGATRIWSALGAFSVPVGRVRTPWLDTSTQSLAIAVWLQSGSISIFAPFCTAIITNTLVDIDGNGIAFAPQVLPMLVQIYTTNGGATWTVRINGAVVGTTSSPFGALATNLQVQANGGQWHSLAISGTEDGVAALSNAALISAYGSAYREFLTTI